MWYLLLILLKIVQLGQNAPGAPLALATGQDAPFIFLEKVTYFLCVIFPNKYVGYYQSLEQELQIPSYDTAICLMFSDREQLLLRVRFLPPSNLPLGIKM